MNVGSAFQRVDLQLESFRALDADDRFGQTAKLAEKAFALAVDIPVWNADIDLIRERLTRLHLDQNVGPRTWRAIAMNRYAVPDRHQSRVGCILIRVAFNRRRIDTGRGEGMLQTLRCPGATWMSIDSMSCGSSE